MNGHSKYQVFPSIISLKMMISCEKFADFPIFPNNIKENPCALHMLADLHNATS